MSQAVIGNLRVDMAMDTAAFAAGAKQAQATLSGLQRSISGFGTSVAGILGGLGLTAIGSQIVDAMRQVAQIGDLAETIGITAEQVQVFNRMALQSGASTDAMAKGLQEIAEQSTDANSKLSQLFAANGITAQGRETNAVIRDFMTLLQNARTPTEQLAMATSVLGTRVGRELVEAFRTGADGVDEATRSMVESGNYHSNAEVERLQKLEEQYNLVAANIATRWQQMVVALATQISSFEAKYVPGAGGARSAVPSRPPLVRSALTVNMGPMGGRGQFAPIKTTVLPPSKENTEAVKKQVVKALVPAPIKVKIAPNTIDDIYGYGPAVTKFTDDLDDANSVAEQLVGTLAGGLQSALSGIASGARSGSDAMDILEQTAISTLRKISEELINSGINDLLSGLKGGGSAGGGIFGTIIKGIGSLFGSFGGFYAKGGSLGAGKWGIAGEAGPEIVHGPSRITPIGDRRASATPVVVKHTVLNYGGAQIEQEERKGPNGERELLTIIDRRMASQMANPYSQASSALDARGARVAKKRR